MYSLTNVRGMGSVARRAALVAAMLIVAAGTSQADPFGGRGSDREGRRGHTYRPNCDRKQSDGGRWSGKGSAWNGRGRWGSSGARDHRNDGGGAWSGGGGSSWGSGGRSSGSAGRTWGGGGGYAYRDRGGRAYSGGGYYGGSGRVYSGGGRNDCGSRRVYSGGSVYGGSSVRVYGGGGSYCGPRSLGSSYGYRAVYPRTYAYPRTYVGLGIDVRTRSYSRPQASPEYVEPRTIDPNSIDSNPDEIDVTNDPPAGCYYYDRFCNRQFSNLDDYTQHIDSQNHAKTIEIIQRGSGERIRTLEFVDGYWSVQN